MPDPSSSESMVVAAGRNWTVASTRSSSLAGSARAPCAAASWTARPAIRVRREAEALPALGASDESSVIISIRSSGSPSASAAIWRSARCAPCPTSAAPTRTTACSDFAAAQDLDRRGGLLGEAERVADVLDPAAMPMPRRIHGRAGSGAPARRNAPKRDSSLLDAALQHRQRADAGRQRLLGRLDAALAVDVAAPELDRVHAERVGEPGDHDLGGELGLRRAEAAKRAGGDVVGVDDVAIDRDVRDLVAAGGEQRGDLGHLGAGRGVGAAVGEHLGLDGRDRAVARRAPAAADADRVALVVGDDRFLAAPDDADAPLQLPGRQRQQVLDARGPRARRRRRRSRRSGRRPAPRAAPASGRSACGPRAATGRRSRSRPAPPRRRRRCRPRAAGRRAPARWSRTRLRARRRRRRNRAATSPLRIGMRVKQV